MLLLPSGTNHYLRQGDTIKVSQIARKGHVKDLDSFNNFSYKKLCASYDKNYRISRY